MRQLLDCALMRHPLGGLHGCLLRCSPAAGGELPGPDALDGHQHGFAGPEFAGFAAGRRLHPRRPDRHGVSAGWGAPLPVADWKWFGGAQSFREVTPSVFEALRASPSDGVFLRDLQRRDLQDRWRCAGVRVGLAGSRRGSAVPGRGSCGVRQRGRLGTVGTSAAAPCRRDLPAGPRFGRGLRRRRRFPAVRLGLGRGRRSAAVRRRRSGRDQGGGQSGGVPLPAREARRWDLRS